MKTQVTKIKLCGLSRLCDIDTANELMPEYIGFVFAKKSRRYVTPETAAALKKHLSDNIAAVGVFVNEPPDNVAALLNDRIIDMAQLHGSEDEEYIKHLRTLTDSQIIKAFRIDTAQDIITAEKSTADHILLDSGEGGTGKAFDRNLIHGIGRPYFLAGGLYPDNIYDVINRFSPYAVDVSSGIETDGLKDSEKMHAFVHAARRKEW